MAELWLPSVQIDATFEEALDATHAIINGTVAEPFDLSDEPQFKLFADGADTTINLSDPFFADRSQATAAEVAAAINSQWSDGTAAAVAGKVNIWSNSYGLTSSVQCLSITGPPDANTIFGWSYAVLIGTAATPQFAIFNRNPANGETGIQLTADVEFDFGWTGSLPVPTDTVLTVEGVVVWSGTGGFQNGWVGTVTPSGTRLFHLVATPPAAYDDSGSVLVNFQSPTASLNESWTFTAADYTAPRVASILATDKRTLRVTFTEAMTMVSSANANDALNPANYYFERQSRPAVEVVAESVSRVDDLTVEITTDIELTFGAPYLLVIADMEDLSGNAPIAPNNDFTFDAFTPPFPDGRRFLLTDFIPNMNQAEDATQELRLMLGIVQEVTNVLLCDVDEWASILDVDTAPNAFLNAMLFQLGNPFQEFVLDEIDKRRLIRLLVAIYKLKGTARGIIDVVRFFLGIEITIDIFNGEGWELGDPAHPDTDTLAPEHDALIGDELSAPGTEAPSSPASLGPDQAGLYTFQIIAPVILTDEERARIVSIAEYMKPAHTHLLRVLDATPPVEIDHVELGLSELGTGLAGGSPGLFILHGPS